MPSRYPKANIVKNDNEYYSSLRRGNRTISRYGTPVLKNPTDAERASLKTSPHIWKYGDRFYKLADQYYGDVRYWWVIAWYNSIPTEATISNGDVIDIPINIQKALRVLGV